MGYTMTTNVEKPYLPWLVWFLGAAYFFYEFLVQIAPGVMQSELMSSFSINAASFGLMGSLYLLAYGCMQLPAGVLLDRFGPRRLLTVATVVCAIGTLLFAMSPHFIFADIARFITGMGSAFAMIGALVLAAHWFPVNRFAFLHGLTLTIGILGAVFGAAPLAMLLEYFTWREVMFVLGAAGILLAFVIWKIVRDRPASAHAAASAQEHHIGTEHVAVGLKRILMHRQSWLTALYGTLMYAPTPVIAWWGTKFLMLGHGLSKSSAAGLVSLMYIGWCIGSPLFGALSDNLGLRKLPLKISAVGTLITILPILYVPNLPIYVVGSLLFLFGFFTCGFVPAFSVVRELHPAKYSGTALGFMNMINSFGAAIPQPLIGIVLDLTWNGTLEKGEKVYSLSNYHVAFSAIPACFILALLILPFIKETHCKTATD